MRFHTKQGDTRNALKATLIDSSGSPADLTGSTVRFKMDCLIDRVVPVVDGQVLVAFEPSEVEKPGIYKAVFEVEYPDGRIETFPSKGYITIYIQGGVC